MKNPNMSCSSNGHSDLAIEWNSLCKNALSPKDRNGVISMIYSSVPEFLYVLGKTITDYSFLDNRIREAILSDDRKSPFSGNNYEDIADEANVRVPSYQTAFTGKFMTGEKVSSEKTLENMRYGRGLNLIVDLVKSKGLDPKNVTYHGNAMRGPEPFSHDVHVFSPDESVWISQVRSPKGEEEVHAISLNENERKEMVSDILDMYKDTVHQGLRLPIEKASQA